MPVSLNPDDFITGGLPLDDVDVEVVDAEFTMQGPSQAYEMKAGGAKQTFAKLRLKILSTGDVHDNYWSCGSTDQYVPNINNPRILEPVAGKSSINQSANFAIFLRSLRDCGFPGSRLAGGDISGLIGLKMHVAYQEQPERRGLNVENRPVLVCKKIISLPSGGGQTAQVAPSPVSGSESYASSDYLDLVKAVYEELVSTTEGSIIKSALWTRLNAKLVGHPMFQRYSAALRDDRFYSENGFVVEGIKVRLPN